MAAITFNTNFDPNPGFEEILDPGGTLVGAATAFAVTNNTGGTLDNYIFRVIGTGFTYNGSGIPTGGSVTGVLILTPNSATTIATISGIPNRNLTDFYNTLVASQGGAVAALSTLLNSQANTVTGSDGADHLLAFGTGDTLTAGLGGDLLWYVDGADHVMIGGTGSDTFRLDAGLGGAIAAIHGSAQNGTGGAGETDVVEVRSLDTTVGTVTNIDRVSFVGAGLTTVSFSASNVNAGLAGNLVVQGSGGANFLQLDRTTASAVNLNLTNWQVASFSGADKVGIDLTLGDTGQHDIVVGSLARDEINGGAGNDNLNGGAGSDELSGGAGNDTLIGGVGVDNMGGEDGDDTFVYGTGAAVVRERANGGAGFDTIRATGSNYFRNGTFFLIERFQFAGAATLTFEASALVSSSQTSVMSDFKFVGDGNVNKVNILSGARATNFSMEGFTFSGWAAADSVTLTGSLGGDTLTGSLVADIINAGGGRDLITGENGNDILNGGAGVDILGGGAGNDKIDGGTEADIVDAGVGNDDVKGGAGNDNLDGGAGNDILNGGAGYDVLAGGAGVDIFLFNAALAGNRDWITDFSVAADTIRLENAIFTTVGAPGVLAAAAFRIGSAAGDATDRIVYDRATGNIFYDRDGTGAAAQLKFAELDAGLALTRADFVVV
jgi:Ca2+-binding RTX toxin-like protein